MSCEPVVLNLLLKGMAACEKGCHEFIEQEHLTDLT